MNCVSSLLHDIFICRTQKNKLELKLKGSEVRIESHLPKNKIFIRNSGTECYALQHVMLGFLFLSPLTASNSPLKSRTEVKIHIFINGLENQL